MCKPANFMASVSGITGAESAPKQITRQLDVALAVFDADDYKTAAAWARQVRLAVKAREKV